MPSQQRDGQRRFRLPQATKRDRLGRQKFQRLNRRRRSIHRPVKLVGSTGRCNTGVKSLRWGFECQSLTWPFVELTSHFVEMSLRIHRQVGPLREVLPQQTIGVFIGTALPRTLRIAEVNVDVGR